MNLETHLKPELWSAICPAYESGQYKTAILDAMHYLSEVLREKSGADGDGKQLAGQALSGNPPVLRLNKLQTQTEKDIQNGFHHIVMGMYEAIRNPRSHEQGQDSLEDADAIIGFIDYLLKQLDVSEQSFTIEGFLEQIADPDFVNSREYLELLINEIPKNKRLDTLIEIFRRKSTLKENRLKLVGPEILKGFSEVQLDEFLAVVSEELKLTSDFQEIRNTLQILRPELWVKINQLAQHRIENKLINGIREGRVNEAGNCTSSEAALATWSRYYLKYFTHKDEAAWSLIRKLESEDQAEHNYVAKFFLGVMEDIIATQFKTDILIRNIIQAIQSGNEPLKESVRDSSLPREWRDKIGKALGEDDWTSNVDDIPF